MAFLFVVAIPLDLVWNVSPSPHGDYAACSDDVTVCVAPGEWWGICRAERFGAAAKSLKSGALSLMDKRATFSACPYYQLLLSKQVAAKLGGDPAKATFAAPGCSSGDVGVAGALAYKQEGRKVRFAPVAAKSCAELKDVKWSEPVDIVWPGPNMPLDKKWNVDIIGDLNQDGHTEVLFSMPHRAVFGTLRDNRFEPLAYTVDTPKLALTDEEKRVAAVVQAHDLCIHWGEEEPYDKARAAEIANNAKRDCAKYKADRNAALKKYPQNMTLLGLPQDP